ncbi:hypothetical protein [Streptomyces dysideae]|uniref:Uncharacterized protein n=1 Tax=Streptomyces dysideae TaxID=909626 RepID=A0A101V0J0_9ACTN|nr:hypothetical protein [Streptomyces dysideae]KUO20275.1 hypothetical protein AQJ91_16015 [Streptomyces dysideae]
MKATEEVLRFAELAARTGLEPGLSLRLDGGPDPVPGAIRVESLSTADLTAAEWCVCTSSLLGMRVGA